MAAVLAFGEVLFDCYPDKKIIGGAPFNVVAHLASLAASPLMITRIGEDEDGQTVLEYANALNLPIKAFQKDKVNPTGYAQVVMTEAGHRFELPFGQAWDYIDGQEAIHALANETPSIIYFGTLAQRHEVSRSALQVLLDALPGVRFIDLNLRPPWWNEAIITATLDATDWLKINDEELKILQTLFNLPSIRTEAIFALKSLFSLAGVILTCGQEGAFCTEEDNLLHQPAHLATDLKDTVGCGDAFASVVILGLLYQWPKEIMLSRASQFAGAIAAIHGALPPAPSFYEFFHKGWNLNG